MGRGSSVYLSYSALVLLSTTSYASADLWTVDIDLGPAPSPEDGPPFSANASRDRSLLPYQVIGVVGAYFATILIITTLLLTVGRSRRKQALSGGVRPIELVKQMGRTFDSPQATHSLRGWGGARRMKSATSSIRSGTSRMRSPATESVASFDPTVIRKDRERQEDDLARFYGHVYEFEEARTQGVDAVAVNNVPAIRQPVPPQRRTNIPTHLRLNSAAPRSEPYPASPRTPISPAMRAIYPPPNYPNAPLSPSHQQHQSPVRNRDARVVSIGNAQMINTGVPKQTKSKLRRSLKDLQISGPMKDDNSDGARTPLSPRFYTDPGVPPEPPSAHTIDSQHYPISPATMRSWREGDEYDDYSHMDAARSIPEASPQRPEVTRLSPPPRRPNVPVINTDKALPFREYQNHFPTSPRAWTVKTTVLETKGRMLGPVTGQATPYSAYMPDKMITPVTATFTTRAERLQKQKEERALRGPIVEEDRVKDDPELWRDPYK
ncbi:unnamed protein product [Zymoseptoria tritici ST99CH_1A5]|uniref:Uncharacterized protein n=1 Tax=Zymoseptoria tritici ST99CH_1A5 TaxID=1276529 RepID=A0A1Y6LFM6_ZYMTR|nr:unnamed protein product [Zymoseptoria tritici ST99CH_1A5]